jgi:hypothetical protein
MDTVDTPDGQTLYVDSTDVERGKQGPFYVAFADSDHTRRWGYVCGNCESTRTAMDSMGRIECDSCGNVRKPTRWDAAYL